MAVLIGALLVAGAAVAGVRGSRPSDVASPAGSPTAEVTMTFTGAPPYSPTPSESPSESPSETVLAGDTGSPEETALPRTGDGGGLLPIVALTLMLSIGGAVLLLRAE